MIGVRQLGPRCHQGAKPMESAINLETTCPHCGAKLRTNAAENDMRADDRVFCSVHGDVGSLDEALRIAVEKAIHTRWSIIATEVTTYNR
jgi:hypothetical protein